MSVLIGTGLQLISRTVSTMNVRIVSLQKNAIGIASSLEKFPCPCPVKLAVEVKKA